MPASREKQPGWLMIGKCGATVKGAGSGAAITRFSAGWQTRLAWPAGPQGRPWTGTGPGRRGFREA